MYTLNFNFKKFTYTKRNKTIEKKLKKKNLFIF